jgi:hypothetical protein
MSPAIRPLSSGTVKFQKYVENANSPVLKNIPVARMIASFKTSFETKRSRTVIIEVAIELA